MQMLKLFMAAAMAAIFPLSATAASLSVAFTKIADTSTLIPSGSGTYASFEVSPAIDNGMVAFFGRDSGSQRGIYNYDGSLSRVADTSTSIPSGFLNFTGFNARPSISGTTVAYGGGGLNWAGSGTTGRQSGVYTGNGTASRVADETTAIPGGTGNFTSFATGGTGGLDIDGNTVVFDAQGSFQNGIYKHDGTTLSKIADKNTAIPGGTGNFTGLIGPYVDGTDVVFKGQGSAFQEGVYLDDGTALTVLVDTTTAIPGGSGNFVAFFSGPAIDNGLVAFNGLGASNQRGIFFTDGSTISKVANQDTSVPGGSGTFNSFSDPAIFDGAVAFNGLDGNFDSGIYIDLGGGLEKIINESDTLEGKILTNLNLGNKGLGDGELVFHASFSDGTQGIYLANYTVVPLPATFWLFGSGLLGLIGVSRQKKTV